MANFGKWDNAKLKDWIERDKKLRDYEFKHEHRGELPKHRGEAKIDTQYKAETDTFKVKIEQDGESVEGEIPNEPSAMKREEAMQKLVEMLMKMLEEMLKQKEQKEKDGKDEQKQQKAKGGKPKQSNEDWLAKLRKDLTGIFTSYGYPNG